MMRRRLLQDEVKQLLEEVLPLADEERRALLKIRCIGREQLRVEVETLVAFAPALLAEAGTLTPNRSSGLRCTCLARLRHRRRRRRLPDPETLTIARRIFALTRQGEDELPGSDPATDLQDAVQRPHERE